MKTILIILAVLVAIPLLLIAPALFFAWATCNCLGLAVLVGLDAIGLLKLSKYEVNTVIKISSIIGAVLLGLYYLITGIP